jgi:hypothetical protein
MVNDGDDRPEEKPGALAAEARAAWSLRGREVRQPERAEDGGNRSVPRGETGQKKESDEMKKKFSLFLVLTMLILGINLMTLVNADVTALSPANIWVGLKNSDDVGAKFDLKVEVYRDRGGTLTLVGSGEVLAVSGGSSGFNNAVKSSITLTPVSGVRFLKLFDCT